VQAFRAYNQALGRCLRHINDYGAIVLLDARFDDVTGKARQSIAPWLRPHVRPLELAVAEGTLVDHFAAAPAFVQRGYRERMGIPSPGGSLTPSTVRAGAAPCRPSAAMPLDLAAAFASAADEESPDSFGSQSPPGAKRSRVSTPP
jgi:hypothetical protein